MAAEQTDRALDISINLISHLWGPNWFLLGGDGVTVNTSQYFLYQLMSTFNYLVLTIVVLIFIWTTAVGVISTAHEGKPLGQRFSTVWVPIRGVAGIAFLTPAFHGLSLLQIGLLQMVFFSINQANNLNTEMLNSFFKSNDSAYSQTALAVGEIPGLAENAKYVGGITLKALMIQNYYTEIKGDQLRNNTKVVKESLDGDRSTRYQFSAPDQNWIYDLLAGQVMASTTVLCDDGKSAICQAKNTAMTALIDDVDPIARGLVLLSDTARPDGEIDKGKNELFNMFDEALDTYSQAIASAMLNNLDNEGNFRKFSDKFIEGSAGRKGWLALGAYYWVLSNSSQTLMEELSKMPQADWADLNFLESFAVSTGDLDAMLKVADLAINSVSTHQQVMETLGPDKNFIREFFAIPADWTTEYFLNSMAGVDDNGHVRGNRDIIANMQDIGHKIIWAGNTVMTGLYFNDSIRSKISGWAQSLKGSSLTSEDESDSDGDGPGAIAGAFVKLLLLGLIVLFMVYPIGIGLAFYLPAVPLFVWVLAGLNWVIGTISLMIGAPIWAAAHSLPDGEGFAGQHGREGYILVINVLLRPILMVIGFLVAFTLIRILGTFLFEIFTLFTTAMNSNFSRGFVTIFANIFLFGMLIIICAQKIFLLIVYFPDTILNFIGKHLPGAGEGGDEQKVNSMFDKFKNRSESLITTKS